MRAYGRLSRYRLGAAVEDYDFPLETYDYQYVRIGEMDLAPARDWVFNPVHRNWFSRKRDAVYLAGPALLLHNDAKLLEPFGGLNFDIGTVQKATALASMDRGDRSARDWIGLTKESNAYDGSGAIVAIIDSGIDSYLFPPGTIISYQTFWGNCDFKDYHGHGTKAASIVTGDTVAAIAPQAKLLIGKITDTSGDWMPSRLLAALNWAIECGAHIVNLSLESYSTLDRALETIYRYATAQNVLIIAAIGNENDAGVSKLVRTGHIGVGALQSDGSTLHGINRIPTTPFCIGPMSVATRFGNFSDTSGATAVATATFALYQQWCQKNGLIWPAAAVDHAANRFIKNLPELRVPTNFLGIGLCVVP